MTGRQAAVEFAGGLLGGLLFCFGLSWLVSQQLRKAEALNGAGPR